MKELVSVIIPAYQEESRIGRCLKNILRSTYPRVELIVVNDGSTDGTEDIVRGFIKRIRRDGWEIRLVCIPNGGLAHARNTGLRHARGAFVGFMDADDMIHPGMIARLAAGLRRGNDISVCGQLVCNEDGKPAWGERQYIVKGQRRRCPGDALAMVMWEQILMSGCLALFRREKILDGEGELKICFPEDVVNFEDFAFVCRYICGCGGMLEVLPFYGYYYCKRRGSLTGRRHSARQLRHALRPVMEIGERMGSSFYAHKLQYAFRFMAYWYEEAYRRPGREFAPGGDDWEICRREMGRYRGIYLSAPNVSLHRKLAFEIAWKYPGLGRILARLLGRILL